MALQEDFNLGGDVTISAAYHRVFYVSMDIDGQTANILVKVYKDKTTRDSGGDPFATVPFQVPVEQFPSYLTATDINPVNINHVSQSYEYLKTLPEYSGATDC